MPKKIEKPWCVCFDWFFPSCVGKIEKESDETAHVRYSEGQIYPLELWDKKYIKRFDTITKAIKHYAKWGHKRHLIEIMGHNFPSQKEEILKINFN